jgi:hypothetical protein
MFFPFFFFLQFIKQKRSGSLSLFRFQLSPAKSFATFDVKKLLRMTEFYPNNFIDVSEVVLHTQLKNYIINVLSDPKFAKLKEFSDLCTKLVETNKCKQ